jgi:RNA polymerase sigma-70 factor (ECF subfamily)
VSEPEPDSEARRIAGEARDRVRFEEEALGLADQVYRVARRLVGSREEAEDLVQDTYARAFRSWRSYTPGTNMRAWLLRILTNLNIDRGRRIQRSPDVQPLEETDYYLANRVAESQGEQALEQERVVESLSQDSIVNALSALPHNFRDVVVLVDIGEFTYADAAQILDVPIGTVMSRLHRGRRQLKQRLAEEATA